MLLAFDERFGVDAEQFAELSQESRRAVQADRRLQIRTFQRLAQHAPELAVHADVDVGIDQLGNVSEMASEREHHVDLGADAFDQPADLRQIGRHVEGAVDRPDDVDPRLDVGCERLAFRNFLGAVFLPEPHDGPVGALPLILVDGARQEPLDIGTLGRDAAADHLGDRAGDHDRRQIGVEHAMRALHGALGAGLAELFLAKSGHHDRQFVRGQRVGIMQHRRDRKVLATHGAIDDDLHALHRGEGVDRPPIAAGTIMVEHQHQIISSALRFLAWASICFLYFSRNAGLSRGVSSQTPAAWPSPTSPKNSFISSKRP